MNKCSMCAGLGFVPKFFWTDYFWTKPCPACNGTGQTREQPVPTRPETITPAKHGDIVSGVVFMAEYIVNKSE